MAIEGRDERVFPALSRPSLVAGVDPKLLVVNYGFVLLVMLLFRDLRIVAVFAVLAAAAHVFLRGIFRKDPWLRPIYIRYMRQADRYDPYPEIEPRRGLRPIGFGRGTL
jgi:type IV secretion system protein VirB3